MMNLSIDVQYTIDLKIDIFEKTLDLISSTFGKNCYKISDN